ncbi:MAG TPA: carboxypeptidase regulatory-like domain-containing protein [Candidatus Acidoferrales bacterium]|nr:carboxypeptidase regulatory-like domain-containing protein [Candidatus Acidoferrales bacterium]
MFFRRVPVMLFLLAFGVLPGYSQITQNSQSTPNRRAMFSIGGSVRDETDHHAMENISVTLKLLTGPTVNTAFTRSNGDFQFDGLTNGDYILEITARDYEAFRETISINEGSHIGMSIFLPRTAKTVKPAVQMSISAHQLSVPHKAHDEFEKGMSLIYLKSDYRAAIAQFQLAIKDFPTYYEAYAEEGSAYYQLQQMPAAEEALRKSIELSSGQYADASFTLAGLLTDGKHFDDAEKAARQGIAADSTSWRGPFELARALNALKKPEDAEKAAQQSRDLMPDNPPVYLLLANIHIQRKDYSALIRDLNDYLRLSPNGPEADQARKTREHAQNLLTAQKNSADGADDKADDDDADPDAAPDKDQNFRGLAPDTSGLPSLPAPTPNQ